MAQEAQEVDVVARVTPRFAVGTRRGRADFLVTIFVKDASRRLALAEGHLSLAELFHSNGIGRTGGTQVTLIVLGRVDPLVLGNRRARQGGKEDGGDTGLHIDRMNARRGSKDIMSKTLQRKYCEVPGDGADPFIPSIPDQVMLIDPLKVQELMQILP